MLWTILLLLLIVVFLQFRTMRLLAFLNSEIQHERASHAAAAAVHRIKQMASAMAARDIGETPPQ